MKLSRPLFPTHWVGFDSMFNELDNFTKDLDKKIDNWPPYNIQKLNDTHFAIELAVAGFTIDDIVITLKDNILTIKGNNKPAENKVYLHKGIAVRSFIRSFTLADSVGITDATLINGMLVVTLEKVVQKETPAKVIKINN